MSGLTALFSSRATQGRRSTRRRVRGGVVAGERLEPRALLTVSVPPSITTDTVEIDDNVVVSDPGGSITATGGPSTSGHVQIFGNSKGRIDGTSGQSNEDLVITADSFITVTGGIGGIQRIDDLTLTSVTAQPVNLQQMVSLTGDLRVTKAGAFTVGSTVTIDGDLVIDDATMVTFSGNVTVGGDLTITNATGVTFAGMLTVGGALTIVNSTGTTRFMGDVSVGSAAVTSTTLVQAMADFTTTGADGDGDVTFTTDQINFTTASLGADPAATDATLVIKPRTTSRALTIASPPGIPAGVNITDADILAIQPGWKRVVFGDEVAGTGAVRIGSIGSQYGGFSQILNTTTIVGGTVQVVQPVDVTPLAIYLELIARGTGTPGSGSVTIDAPINQTAEERSVWVRLESAGSIAINAPVWADQIVSLTTTAGGTITQGGTAAAITATALAVDADGAVTLADSGNAFSLVAIKTTNDSVVLREDSGYSIAQLTTIDDGRDARPTATVIGIDTGTATVRLVTVSAGTASTVGQGRAILAGGLGLEGAGTDWNLSLATNDIATLAADTGSIVFRDVDDLTIDTVAAVSPRAAISGITVARTLDVEAGTTLTITAAGDLISAASSGTAVNLQAPSGISTAGDVITAGGDVEFDHATTLTGDIVLDLEDGPRRGLVTFFDAVDGTTGGQESLTIGGDLDAELSIGAAVALQSLSVSGDSALAGGITLRTTGNQTYSGEAWSINAITIQAGSGSTVAFLGKTTLGGLLTATGDTAAYNVSLTGSPVSITNAVTFANTGTVTLGDADTDSLTFVGGVTSTAPTLTNLAGTIATTNAAAVFGQAVLAADTTVSTGAGAATFSGTLDGGFSLAVNASGTTTFSAAVGGTTRLVSLTTNAGGTTAINGGTIKTSGASGQVFNDAVTLGASTTFDAGAGVITFASTLDGGFATTVNTSGTTTFGGAVGGTAALVSLITDAGGTTTINGGAITTSGAAGQVYNDAVTLGANAILAAGANGPIRFAATVDGAYTLAANTQGATTFEGAVGGTASLVSLTTDAGGTTAINGGAVSTSGGSGQVYHDAVTLGADTVLTADNSGPITFATTLDGPHALSANTQGTTTFGGAVGGVAPLAALVTDAGGVTRIDGGAITTAAPLVFVVVPGDDVGALVESGQFYNDAVVLGANAVLTAGGGLAPAVAIGGDEIAFASTVDGASSLTVNTAGITTFAGAVGDVIPLASLFTDAAGSTSVTGRLVRTTGNQTYADPLMFEPVVEGGAFDLEVLLPAEDEEDADLESSIVAPPETRLIGATVTALQGITGGGHDLVIEGNAVFGDQPGSLIPDEIAEAVDPVAELNDLRITGTTTVNSTSIASTGLQTYESAVTLGSDVLFQGSGQRFESTVTGPGRTLLALGLGVGVLFDGDVGTAASPLGPISVVSFFGTVQINAAIHSTGPVTIAVLFGTIDGGPNNAIHAPGSTVSIGGLADIGATTPIAVEAASVDASSMGGDIHLRGIGDLVVGEQGLVSGGVISLDASGDIRVPGGRTLQADDGVITTKPIRWGLLGTADSGRGSLRDVIGQANATRAPGIVEFGNTPTTFSLQSQLPDITTSLVLDGGGQVTIAGNSRVLNGLTFAAGSSGSELSGVSLQGFRNFGVRLMSSPGVTVEDVSVTSLNTAQSMGLYATGNLTGTTIVGSRFSGGLRGALLINARNLAFGQIGRGNTFIGNRSVPGSRFAGTGIRAQGDSSGTVVQGNTFTQNHYGFAFINARNLRLANNLFTRNTIAAIFVEGNNVGSTAVGNTFGSGGQKNAKTFHRVRGATGV